MMTFKNVALLLFIVTTAPVAPVERSLREETSLRSAPSNPLLVYSTPRESLSCGTCTYWPTPVGVGSHVFGAGGETFLEASEAVPSMLDQEAPNEVSTTAQRESLSLASDDDARFDCQSWNSCHGDYQSGACAAWHDACGGGEALADALAAVKTGSIAQLLEAARVHSKNVKVNGQRGIVQIFACDGHLVRQEEFAPSRQVRRVGAL